jgi:hypothetical protein
MVYVLSKNPRIKRISTFLMSVDTTEPEELRRRAKRCRAAWQKGRRTRPDEKL